jgi:uncharacterized protein (TIGR03067 family)
MRREIPMDVRQPDPDVARLIGTWKSIRIEPQDISGNASFTLVDVFDHTFCWWIIPGDVTSYKFEYYLDSSKTPKHMDISNDEGTSHGIYLLDGDRLITCFPAEDGAERPTSFVACRDKRWSVIESTRLSDGGPTTRDFHL